MLWQELIKVALMGTERTQLSDSVKEQLLAFGIQPDIEAELSEKDLRNFTADDLGTQKDSQYRVAEQTLLGQLQRASAGTTYKAGSSNLSYALR